MEKWKNIIGFEDSYMVSDLGNIKSIERLVNCKNESKRLIKERILKPNIGTNGYKYVNLEGKTKYIHRLVALHFIKNEKKLSDVDHINGDKLNNNINNLRWLSHFENSSIANKGICRKSNKMDKNPRSKKVFCYENDKLIKIYDCAKYISLEYGINYSTLRVKLQKDKLIINNKKYRYETRIKA
jgi:hypothetical protein